MTEVAPDRIGFPDHIDMQVYDLRNPFVLKMESNAACNT